MRLNTESGPLHVIVETIRIWKWLVAWLTPLILILVPTIIGGAESRCAYVVILMAIYWLTEAIPLPITSILPLYLFPLLDIMPTKDIAAIYSNETLMIFLGSVMATVAFETTNLHERIALRILMLFGTSPVWLLLGFMSATAFLSMFIMNIAATVLMLPTVDAILDNLKKKRESVSSNNSQNDNMGSTINIMTTIPEGIAVTENGHTVTENGYTVTENGGPNENGLLHVEETRERKVSISEPVVTNSSDASPNISKNRKQSVASITTTRSRRLSIPVSEFELTDSLAKLTPEERAEKKELDRLRTTIYLGIAFASGIGGTGTLTGTPPNMIFKGMVGELIDDKITYANWMFYAIPPLIVSVLLLWLFLCIFYLPKFIFRKKAKGDNSAEEAMKVMRKKYEALGPIEFDQWAVLLLCVLLICLWFFRDPDFMRGWSRALYPDDPSKVDDASVGMIIVTLMFLVPAVPSVLKYSLPLVDWKTINESVPWGVYLLIGGSFAMAEGAKRSGLSSTIGSYLTDSFSGIDPIILAIIFSAIASIISEFTSFSATAAVLLPIVKDIADSLHISPLKFMLPVTLSCSLAYMFPASTPSNAVVFEASKFRIIQMAMPGLVAKLLCLAVVIGTINSWAFVIYKMSDPIPDTNSTESILI